MKVTKLIASLFLLLAIVVAIPGLAQSVRNVIWSNTCAAPYVLEMGANGLVECVEYSTAPTPTPTDIPPTPPPVTGTLVIDHSNVEALFAGLTDLQVAQAANTSLLFADRSVGDNINDGLTCLSYPDVQSAPNHCKRPDAVTAGFTPGTQYNRSQWDFVYAGTHPEFYGVSLAGYDVIGYLPNYLEFAADKDLSTLMAYQAQLFDYYSTLSNKVMFFTGSLARTIGTTQATVYNAGVRNYVAQNGGVLVDVADIESHALDGSECVIGINPIICSDYTSEVNGGHLGSPSAGKIKIAKAMWVAMAHLGGQVVPPDPTPIPPDPTPVPPDPTPVPPDPTPIPPTPAPTQVPPTPAPTANPGDPYPGAPECTSHDPRVYHGLWNSQLGCHYDHTHADDPASADWLFGNQFYGWAGGEISYPWQTFSAMGQENDIKHIGYFWLVRTSDEVVECQHALTGTGDQVPNPGCINGFRTEFHGIFNDHGARTRYHSFYIEAQLCKEGGTDCGIIRTGGWQDHGSLTVDDAYVITVTRDEVLTNSPRPVKLHYTNQFATWYPVSAFSRVAMENADNWGIVQPYGPEFLCYPDPGCENNNSLLQPHVIGFTFPTNQFTSDGVRRNVAQYFDPDGDGKGNFDGFSDRYGRILVDGSGAPVTSCEIGLDCVPLILENVDITLDYQLRGGQIDDGTRHPTGRAYPAAGYREYDIYFNGQPSGWIEYTGP